MKKQIISSLLALTMLCSLSTAAFAYGPEVDSADSTSPAETETVVTVVNNSRYLTDAEAEEMKEDISAGIILDSGEAIPVDCTVTIEDVDSDMAPRQAGSRTYRTTVRASTPPAVNSGKKDGDGVEAYATLTMDWTDVPGIANDINAIQGHIDVVTGTLRNSDVFYGDTHNRPLLRDGFITGTDRTFLKYVNYTSTSLTGSLHVCYRAWFTGVPDARGLFVCVNN